MIFINGILHLRSNVKEFKQNFLHFAVVIKTEVKYSDNKQKESVYLLIITDVLSLFFVPINSLKFMF